MNNQKLKVLLIVEQCNPEAASVPLVGYKFFQAINKLADVTLVTHERNKTPLSKLKEHPKITYIAESELTKKYFAQVVYRLTMKGKNNWPLANPASRINLSEKQVLRSSQILESILPKN